MATFTNVCMMCGKVISRQEDLYYKEPVTSHGYCDRCGREYEKEVERQIEELKRRKK